MKYLAGTLLLGFFLHTLAAEEFLVSNAPPGRYGGALVVAQRSEPKTLNPVLALDNISREAIDLILADLIHINRASERTEPALATSVDVSKDGRRYVAHLRTGVRFSDGYAFDADDVLFTFQVYLDEKVHAPQRDLLIVGGKPVSVSKLDAKTVVFEFAEPYGPGDRLFDSLFILPRHLLLKPYSEGKLAALWGLKSTAAEIAGLGPFRFKQYVPGQTLTLEKNPYYWKQDTAGQRLPYLTNVIFEYVGSEDAQVVRFQTGAADIITRLSARNFDALARRPSASQRLTDAGPGLEYNFLFFNLNDLGSKSLPRIESKQAWFRSTKFRQAISAAIDREAIARLVYAGRAAPIQTQVTPGNKLWRNTNIRPAPESTDQARQLLASAGFSWDAQGKVVDRFGKRVEFSVATSSGNGERIQMATMIQQDLERIGIETRVVSLEFRTMLDRITTTLDYEACVLGLASGDVDPGSEMSVWPSGGSNHLWELRQAQPLPAWQIEIDRLMTAQMSSIDPLERKRLYDRVQELIAINLPIIPLVSPDVLVGSKTALRNFRPAVLLPYAVWNADQLFWAGR